MTLHHRPQESVTYMHQSPQHLRLLLAGHRHEPQYRQPMVMARPHLLLTWIESGKGMVRDHQDQQLKAGDWYALFPDEVLWVSTDADDPMCYFWMGIACDDALSLMRQCGMSPDARIKATKANKQTCQHFTKLIKHLAVDSPASQMLAVSSMWQLLGQLGRSSTTTQQLGTPHGSQQAIDQACQIMQHHYVEGINASQVADLLGVDRSHLSTRFKAVMGLTMLDYLTRLRINRAQWLLRHSELTVNEIADAVGYREYRSFIRSFRHRTGLTPRVYANHVRGLS